MNKPLKAALIGSGMIAETHITAMRGAGIEVIGIYSVDQDTAARLASDHGMTHYMSMTELLAGEADFAAICTPSGTHAELAMTLMENGKHAIVEKPAVITEEDGIRLLETERKTGKICAPISQLRFSEAYRTVKAAVDRGDFGTLLLGILSMKYYRSPEYFAGSWRGTKAMDGGGALMNQGIHGIDMLCGLLGYPVKISGHTATLYHHIEVEDTAVASLVFPCGALGVINGGTAIAHAKPRRLELCGTKAGVTMEEDRIVLADGIELAGSSESKVHGWIKPSDIGAELHQERYMNIAAALRGEEKLYYTAQDAVNTVNVILSIYRASETGETSYFES